MVASYSGIQGERTLILDGASQWFKSNINLVPLGKGRVPPLLEVLVRLIHLVLTVRLRVLPHRVWSRSVVAPTAAHRSPLMQANENPANQTQHTERKNDTHSIVECGVGIDSQGTRVRRLIDDVGDDSQRHVHRHCCDYWPLISFFEFWCWDAAVRRSAVRQLRHSPSKLSVSWYTFGFLGLWLT